ncbi:hypothetical protein A2J03_22175 [Rhodococcus sp. EPR-157]|uniref:hypothetical protein n=1 Tax=Rhodococcus sp. EPR-157 TaxID=1813677 RepID=UPI0007BBF861|nr:hypothetical protein [Rhodococcus sp. EPR-157]KZF07750.1 hypothetical protein A2J03_22175 [Rhodococcus sp. EPR-157]
MELTEIIPFVAIVALMATAVTGYVYIQNPTNATLYTVSTRLVVISVVLCAVAVLTHRDLDAVWQIVLVIGVVVMAHIVRRLMIYTREDYVARKPGFLDSIADDDASDHREH